MKKMLHREVKMESDWISFWNAGKEVAGFGFVPEQESYPTLCQGWLNGSLGLRAIRAEVKKICEG